jgi:alpha-2-macroglobulin
MKQSFLRRRTRSFVVGATAVLAAFAIWLTPQWQASSNPAKPGITESGPMPRVAEPTPLFAEIEPAKNPLRLCLQDDGRKVLGWISGTDDFKGWPVYVTIDGDKEKREAIHVDKGNTFVWEYKLDKPTKVGFHVTNGNRWLSWLADTITVAPAVAEKEPSVFFIVDRTAYRPTQSLNFAGFLRKLTASGEFEPIANTEVDVQLVSQQKQTKAFKMRLTSDEHGKINASYVFSDADALDTYTLQIPGYKGSAKLLLGEYRKSKIRLKITGDVKEEKLDLKFETVDFLDKAVAAAKVSFTIQVVEKTKADKSYPLKAEEFAYYSALGAYSFDLDDLPEEDRLLWIADNVPPRGAGNFQAVVAQFQHDMALNGAEPGKHTIDLKKEWKTGNFLIQVQGIVTDANGREQRATHTISLKCDKALPKQKLEVAKEIFVTGEKILARLTTEDGKAPEGATSLVVMKLSPAPMGGLVDYGYGYNYGGYYSHAGYSRYPRQLWNQLPKEEQAKRTLVTALPLRNDSATVKLTEPGAYKLVAVTHHDDGRTTQCEAGLVVKNSEDLTPFALRLDKDEYATGDRLSGTIFSRYGGARVLVTLRDSSGIRFAKPFTLSDMGVVRIDEALPAGMKYACNVDVHYLDEKNFNHVLGRMIRVTPTDRMIRVTAKTKDEVKPGEMVHVDLQVDRQEEVDLVVSVYDQSLLGINPDKSVDIRNFYLADERVRTLQAKDLLRRKLGDVTLEAVLKKAEDLLKADPNPNDPPAQQLKAAISQLKTNNYIYSPHLMTLMRLAGVEVMQNPVWYAYHGTSWHFYTHNQLKKPLREVVEHKQGEFYLVFGLAGDAVMMHEMHPSWVNVNPMAYYGRYAGRYAYQNGFDQFAGYGRSMPPGGFGGGRGGARGDSHMSISGNSSGSFAEGQGFISHMPIGPASAPLIDAGPDQGHISVRRDFSDSAFWNATVRTDKAGKASVDFKVPDSLTNWQVVVTAVSKKMHVGQTKSQFRTFKPIMVWPMLPRTFVEGDRVEVFGAVHNRTEQGQNIKVRLKVENGEILSPEEKTVWVEAKASVNVYWNFVARQPGFTQLLMSVDCPEGSDASLKRLPVIRAAAEQIITKSGQVRDGTTFTIPADVDLNSARLEISFAPSLAADMADTLNFLVDYPYGCVEQTMSRFLPAIKVAQILKQYEVNHPELLKKMPGVVAAGIKRLLELQQGDGGWGWQGGSQTHEMMTPYALYGLLQAEKAGYVIPNETAIQRGLQRLRYFIDLQGQQGLVADRIYCMYVWSHREKLEQQHWDWLTQQQKDGKLSDYANALCVEMCMAQDKKDLAKKFVEDLRAKAQKNSSGQISWKTAGFSRWMEDPFEITAAAMKAIVAFDKDDALIDGILGFFAATKRGDRWNSTKDTAMILFALCDYLAKATYNPDAKNELTYTLNGKKPSGVKFDDKLTKRIAIDGSELKNGDNKLTFKTEMTGVMYRMVLRYWKSGRDIEPMEKGIKVTRKFHLWDEKTKQIKRELKDGEAIDRGSYVVCDVTATYDTPGGMRFMLMECPKPSTAEIIPVDDPRFAHVQQNTGYALREERMASVAFHHEQTGQTIMNRTVMLAELCGDYVVPPAFVELMYQTEVRGHSGTFALKVKE